VSLRDDNVIGQEALRRVQSDLDLDEVRSLDDLPEAPVRDRDISHLSNKRPHQPGD
jgi:hypothetical protein